MFPPLRRWIIGSFLAIVCFLAAFHTIADNTHSHRRQQHHPRPVDKVLHPGWLKPKFSWSNVKQRHPVDSFTPIPSGTRVSIPKIQHDFEPESRQQATERERRLSAVEEAFKHSWEGYKKNAWLQDEVAPLSGAPRNPFGGWAATLVDSLDTLWVMGLKKDFEAAVRAVKKIDFGDTRTRDINVFETTIRYMGGMLSAYDVSGHKYKVLLEKAIELGDMLYHAFDTPNRMPVTRWDWQNTALGIEQQANKQSLVAEVGSLTLEFTRLSQLTGDPKWYDAVARVTNAFEASQNETKIPGLWPVYVDVKTPDFTKDTTFTLGGMADSLYEYLPKQHVLLGGHTEQYRNMFQVALQTAKERIFFRPLNPNNDRLLVPGTVKRYSAGNVKLQPQGEHLACFAGGMVALAAKVFHQTHDLEVARELVDGCLWAYESMPTGIMPEIFSAMPCLDGNNIEWENCTWHEDDWERAVMERVNHGPVATTDGNEAQTVIKQKKLAPGFTEINDARYILRPEAIESVFVLYRITGDKTLQDKAWQMFNHINNATRTSIAYAALKDVRQLEPERVLLDNMESFWTAGTMPSEKC